MKATEEHRQVVLVTGATGFIGRASLQSLLNRGYEVHAVYRRDRLDFPKEITWHQGDMLDREFVDDLINSLRPSHLLAFAWHMVPGDTYPSLENFRWVEAGIHLLRCFGHYGGQRIVMAGSCMEYDWNQGICSESSTQFAKNTLYSTAKHALHLSFESICEKMEISGAWGRLFFVYGPHENPQRLAASIILSLLEGRSAGCTKGEFARDFLHVQDAAEAYTALLDSKVEGAVNIGSGEAIMIRDLALLIGEKMRKTELIEIGAIPQRGIEPPLVCADTKRLTDEIGWKPHFSLDTGIDDTISWWRTQQEQETLRNG